MPQDWREAARRLIEAGVPIFIAKRSKEFPVGGSDNTGYHFPAGWQQTKPDPKVLGRYREGDALCAVMGHVVDGLDCDPRHGGEVPPSLMPISYGRQSTPSGGTHDLIASLGVRSMDGVMPGVDVKAGTDGTGHGLLFLAPTEKLSKTTGEVGVYEWLELPDLEVLDLVGDGNSGENLRALINSARSFGSASGEGYSGPSFEELTPEQQSAATDHQETLMFDWAALLAQADNWVEGERDEKGRGWEALARDFAWAVASWAVCPWMPLTEDEAQEFYEDALPTGIGSDPKCKGKWYEGILEKAAGRPANLPPWWSSLFFDQTEELRLIRDAAYASIVTPNGMLANVLGRILAEVPVTTMLPPLSADKNGVGSSPASLNLGIAMVAGSGGGKSSTRRASRNVLGFYGVEQKDIEKKMGSGEGMVDLYLEPEMSTDPETGKTKPTGKKIVIADPRRIIVCDEVEQMAAVGNDRKGSTAASTLREALTGEPLGQSNAEASGRSRHVPEMAYRAVVMVGVQPARSDILLNEQEVSVGTPQRFLWCSMDDVNREIPHPDESPEWPGSLDWEPPAWPELVKYPERIRREVREQQWKETRGEGSSGLDGHARLTRLKVAFALAVLHDEVEITERWWNMAGQVMAMSRETQERCREVLSVTLEKREIYRETRKAKAIAEANDVVAVSRLQKAAEAVIKNLQKRPHEALTWSTVKPHLRYRDGLETEEIMDEIRILDSRVTIDEYEAQGRVAYKLTYSPEGN